MGEKDTGLLLIDSNIILEMLLKQERAEECALQLTIYKTSLDEETEITRISTEKNLDFDDSLQYFIKPAKEYPAALLRGMNLAPSSVRWYV